MDNGSEEHETIIVMLQEWIHLEFPEPCRPIQSLVEEAQETLFGSTPDSMPFQGDQLDELLCKVLWNLDLRREDVEQFRSFFCGSYPLFPEGLSVCQFPDATSLRRWKERLFLCGFSLQQDSGAFYLAWEKTRPDANLPQPHYFYHVHFPDAKKRRRSNSPGAWWGLPKDVWNSSNSETHKRFKRSLGFSQRASRSHGHISAKIGQSLLGTSGLVGFAATN